MSSWYKQVKEKAEEQGKVLDQVTFYLEDYLKGNKHPSIHGFAHYLNNELVAEELDSRERLNAMNR